MDFEFHGHSCFTIQLNGKKILFDPFITSNPSAKDKNLSNYPADYICVTHGHFDHVEDLIAIAKNTGALVISNYEICSWCEKKGVDKVHPFNFGGEKKFDFGSVKFVYAQHSSVLPDGTYGGNPGGFVINSVEKNIYVAGDTSLTQDMKLIPLYTKLDVCILPIGDNFTMGIQDAVFASNFVECDTIIGVHFDTFEIIKINHHEAKSIFELKNKRLILPSIGEKIKI